MEETGPKYELLQGAYQLSKDGWCKMKTYPVLATVLPFAETTTAFALDKAGLPELAALETAYITPTLSELDIKYVSPLTVTTIKKFDETKDTVKAKYEAATDSLGSRKEDVDGYKAQLSQKYGATRDAVVEKYDSTKEAVLHAVSAAKTSVASTFAKSPETTAE